MLEFSVTAGERAFEIVLGGEQVQRGPEQLEHLRDLLRLIDLKRSFDEDEVVDDEVADPFQFVDLVTTFELVPRH